MWKILDFFKEPINNFVDRVFNGNKKRLTEEDVQKMIADAIEAHEELKILDKSQKKDISEKFILVLNSNQNIKLNANGDIEITTNQSQIDNFKQLLVEELFKMFVSQFEIKVNNEVNKDEPIKWEENDDIEDAEIIEEDNKMLPASDKNISMQEQAKLIKQKHNELYKKR